MWATTRPGKEVRPEGGLLATWPMMDAMAKQTIRRSRKQRLRGKKLSGYLGKSWAYIGLRRGH